MASILENLHNVITVADRPMWTKFGTSVQNRMPITIKSSKSKPAVEFPYGVRLFSNSGSSSISAMG